MYTTLKTNIQVQEIRDWRSSSPLEVEELDAIGKHKEENKNPCHMDNHNHRKEIIVISPIVFEVLFHCCWSSCWKNYSLTIVTQLRSHKAIDGPSNRRKPVVPPWPHRKLLQHMWGVFVNFYARGKGYWNRNMLNINEKY